MTARRSGCDRFKYTLYCNASFFFRKYDRSSVWAAEPGEAVWLIWRFKARALWRKNKTITVCVHAQNALYISIQNDLFSTFNTLMFSSGPFVRFLSFIIRPGPKLPERSKPVSVRKPKIVFISTMDSFMRFLQSLCRIENILSTQNSQIFKDFGTRSVVAVNRNDERKKVTITADRWTLVWWKILLDTSLRSLENDTVRPFCFQFILNIDIFYRKRFANCSNVITYGNNINLYVLERSKCKEGD